MSEPIIAFTCPACGKGLKARAAFAGGSANCSQCKTPVRIPEAPATSESATEVKPASSRRKTSFLDSAADMVFQTGYVFLAVILCLGGVGECCISWNRSTSNGGVHNIGLLHDQTNGVIIGCAAAIAGLMMLLRDRGR